MKNEATKQCDKCGKSLAAHEPFCPHCGKPQPIAVEDASAQDDLETSPEEADEDEIAAIPASPDQPPAARRRRWALGRAIIGCLLVFICVVLVYLAIGGVAAYQGLQERLALNRQQATVHFERGLAHTEDAEYELAIAEFEHTLRLDPAHREAREALREAKTTALAQPTPTSATLNEATIAILAEAEGLMQEQKWEEAIQRLSQLRDLAPDFQEEKVSNLVYTAYLNLGKQSVDEGQVDDGLYAFDQALAERPADPEASRQLDLASLYVSAQATWGADWPSTIDFLEQLYTLIPDYLDVSVLLYQAYEAYGDDLSDEQGWCLAELQYEQAALLEPDPVIQGKWDEAARLCRTPTPSPTPITRLTATPARPIAGTATATATTGNTQTTGSASGSILFSRFNDNEARWEILAVTPGDRTPAVILNYATQPATSPNGQLLAYHAELDEAEGLHVLNMATGEDVRITTFREDVTPDWSPDNLRFVFPSQRSGDRRWQIYVGWADAKGDPVALVDGRTPAWSQDGTLIAYQGTDAEGNNPGLYLISADGGPVTRLTENESDRAPAWSPNCTTGLPVITNEGMSATPSGGSSGAGCSLAFMSSRSGDWEIYTIDVSSGRLRRLTTSGGNDGLPTWSPDGNQIAFVSDRDGNWGIYVMPAAGGNAVKVADWGEEHAEWLVERITWMR